MRLLALFLFTSSSVLLNLNFIVHANQFTLKFIDIGQGDAVLVRTPTNCTMFIDGGSLNNLTDQIHKHLPPTEQKIDLMVLTHPHLDHMGGLIQLLNRYQVENLFTTGVTYPSSFYNEFNRRIADTNVVYPRMGEQYNLCGVIIDVIYPDKSLIGKEIDNVNNASIVLQLTIDNSKIYLSGDAEEEVEEEILEFDLDLKSDIMKAGHHGSETSNTKAMLNVVDPEVLVIQSGEGNQYDHPHYETIAKANELGIKVRRNDNEGTITFFF